jgi:hypothetical protein
MGSSPIVPTNTNKRGGFEPPLFFACSGFSKEALVFKKKQKLLRFGVRVVPGLNP